MSDNSQEPDLCEFEAELAAALRDNECWTDPTDQLDATVMREIHAAARRAAFCLLARRLVLAAACLLLAGLLAVHLRGPQTPPIAADVNADGQVDILDAFALARALDERTELLPAWDITGDGTIDAADVEAIARRAVAIQSPTNQT